jgi:hypothetical protein
MLPDRRQENADGSMKQREGNKHLRHHVYFREKFIIRNRVRSFGPHCQERKRSLTDRTPNSLALKSGAANAKKASKK